MKSLSQISERLAFLTSWVKKRISRRDRVMALGLFLIWLYIVVGFCLWFAIENFWLGILFVLIFIPIYHWNLNNLGISSNESVLTFLCSVPTVVSIGWLLCLTNPTLSAIASVATSFTLVGYSYTTIEVASKHFGKARSIGLVTLVSCLGLTLGWFLQDCLPNL
jgi:hypothetical protein